MPHPYFSYAAVAVAVLPGIHGIRQLINPLAVIQSVHIVVPRQPETPRLAGALLRITAIRNFAVISIIALIWLRSGDEKTLGLAMLGPMAMATVDGAVVRNLTGGNAAMHWMFTPICGFISAGLLGLWG